MKLRLLISTLFFLIAVTSITLFNFNTSFNTLMIEIESAPSHDIYQLFYDVGNGYREKDSISTFVKRTETAKVFFHIPTEKPVKGLRIDPGRRPGMIVIKSIQLGYQLFFYFHPLYQWTAQDIFKDFHPVNHINFFAEQHDAFYLRATREDPHFISRVDFDTIYAALPKENRVLKTFFYLLAFIATLILFFAKDCRHFYRKTFPFTPHTLIKYYFIFALALIMALAANSRYGAHPDEHHHFLTVKYYMDHWLPPEIGDPAAEETYSGYGMSYINTLGVSYFLAGKFAALLSPLFDKEITAVRAFNFSLFLILMLIYFYRAKKDHSQLIPLTLLLIAPQVWYVFSYINSDAFALFLSFLLVSELTYRDSPLNHFLRAPGFRYLIGGILFGLLLGILFISKRNYQMFILFIAFWFVFSMLTLNNKITLKKIVPRILDNKRLFYKYGFIILIAATVVGLRHSLDTFVNGPDRQAKLIAYQQQIAKKGYKHDPAKKDDSFFSTCGGFFPNTYKNRGVKYRELFSEYRWHEITFASFVGVYGYMSITMSVNYYVTIALLYMGFAVFFAISVLKSKKMDHILFALGGLILILLMIFASSLHSWTCDFQPQGRYLFPILGVASLLLYQNRHYLNNVITHSFITVCFIMSAYSFLFRAL